MRRIPGTKQNQRAQACFCCPSFVCRHTASSLSSIQLPRFFIGYEPKPALASPPHARTHTQSQPSARCPPLPVAPFALALQRARCSRQQQGCRPHRVRNRESRCCKACVGVSNSNERSEHRQANEQRQALPQLPRARPASRRNQSPIASAARSRSIAQAQAPANRMQRSKMSATGLAPQQRKAQSNTAKGLVPQSRAQQRHKARSIARSA